MRSVTDENRRLREAGKKISGKRGKIVSWKERLMARPQSKRPCVHHMKGRINFRACTNEYRCGNCEFDQYFNDQYMVHALVSPVDVLDIKGFRVPQGYYLHPGHAWMKIEEGSTVRVGLDDFALRLLGPFDRIEAPLMGKEVKQGRDDIVLARGAFEARVLSPVSGVVTAINAKQRTEGIPSDEDPYSDGWVMNIHANQLRQDLRKLMIYDETQAFLSKEVDRLHQVVEEVAGPLAADGGHFGNNIFGNMPDLGWERLTRTFLHT